MIYGSVCSGIESASVAWHPLGWKPAFFSEIDKSCRDVLTHRWPDVPLFGDFTKIKSEDVNGTIDLLVGGTPCQDFSVAGLRKGITGSRGGLTLEFLHLVKRLRPTWVVWENVPGILSIDGGRAFGAFLGGLGELGYGTAYRVLDAQFYGVAQRRRRVFVVGYFGDWRPPAAVLFDGESMSGNPAPSREARQNTSCDVREGVAGTLGAHKTGGWGNGNDLDTSGAFIPEISHTLKGEGFDGSEDGTGRGTPIVAGAMTRSVYNAGMGGRVDAAVQGYTVPVTFDRQSSGEYGTGLIASTLNARDYKGATDLIAFDSKGSQAHVEAGDLSPTLRSMNSRKGHHNGGGQVAIAFAQNQVGEVRTSEISGTLNTNANASGRNKRSVATAIPILESGGRTGKSTTDIRAGIGVGEEADPMFTLQAGKQHAVALDLRNALRDPEKHDEVNRQGVGIGDDCANTITTGHQGGVATYSAVRRLTPKECERLQGFEDDYTFVPIIKPFRLKGSRRSTERSMTSDSARYRMIGNSKAVPVIRKIGERIDMVNKMMEQLK